MIALLALATTLAGATLSVGINKRGSQTQCHKFCICWNSFLSKAIFGMAQGAILKGRPNREGEGGSGKVDKVREVAWVYSIDTFLNADIGG